MATKQERYKKLPSIKTKKISPAGSRGARPAKLNEAELEEGAVAADLLKKRSTSEFSRNELGALMQVPPGGAEPHQIKKQSRQFNRVAGDLPESVAFDKVISPATDRRKVKPMSDKTPKIDLND
jgi:hypothetical protein